MKKYITKKSMAVFIGIFLMLTASAAAQENFTDKVDGHVRGVMQKQNVPGVSVAVVKEGKVVLAKGYGLANVEHQVPVKPETVFQSGSVGKQFTATAVMMLVEEGKINLDEKIGKYLGESPDTWKNITVRHLLTHTAGMTDYPKGFDFRRDYTEDELLKIAQNIPTAFEPGEKFQYSNLGYVTLGILISKVTGKFYGEFLRERIFQPSGMTTARVITEADIVPNRAAGYRLVKGELKNQNWVSPVLNTTADGSLYLTVLDLAKWDAALYGETLLKKASLDQMWTPVSLNNGKISQYGFGWGVGKINNRRLISHNGAWQGFMAHIGRYVDDKITVIVLANLSGFNVTKLAEEIAGIYNPELALPVLQAIEDKEPQVTTRAKELLQKIAAGTVEQELFTAEAKEFLFPDRIKQVGAQTKSLGALEKFELVERATANGAQIYRYRAGFKNASIIYSVSITEDGKIAALNFRLE